VNRITLLIIILLISVGCSENQIKSTLPSPPTHHLENGFQNLYISPPPKSFFSFLQMRFFSDVKWAKHVNRSNEVAYKKLDLTGVNNPSKDLQISWLGHSTFLIQYKGLNILTDPVFSDRASPFSFVGPKRYIDHNVPYNLLPKIDFVVISHNHYGHLDTATIKFLGNNPIYLVPLKLKSLFIDLGIKSDLVKEFDWWEKVEFPKLKIQAMPSQHWSARSLIDRNETLWAIWFM
jgi:N-acyl-phosphatidylethanolamine-hydrolysing phospholipase D